MVKKPKVGDPAPDFELEGTEGRFSLSEHRGERVVLLFYPGDFTPVCTKQFCSYAERAEDMSSLGATVVGISAQDVDSHTKFVNENGIPVALLADPDKKVAKAYGASAPMVGTRRAVFIVDEEGKLAYKHTHTLGLDFQTVDEIKDALAKV
jgi:thioredoxin-dependent peroxiredoxin